MDNKTEPETILHSILSTSLHNNSPAEFSATFLPPNCIFEQELGHEEGGCRPADSANSCRVIAFVLTRLSLGMIYLR